MSGRTNDADALLTPAEVAALFRVDPKTVTRWAKAGKLTSIRTLGGHRRYRAEEVRALLDQTTGRSAAAPAPARVPAAAIPAQRPRPGQPVARSAPSAVPQPAVTRLPASRP